MAFCLYHYFPFGGLQRDFLRIAKECVRVGHSVDVYTMQWEGESDHSFSVNILPVKGWQNHTRAQNFVKQFETQSANKKYDLVIGFNKMPGLDVYYAADTCYQAKAKAKEQRSWWNRITPRYHHLINYEKAVFDKSSKTQVLLIARKQQDEFQKYYQTPAERFHLLPPGIAKDRIAPINADEIRRKTRAEWKIKEDDFLLLMIGSGFKTKGLDRAIKGLADLPQEIRNRTHFYIIGEDRADLFQRLAKQLGVLDRITFLGGRLDVPQFLLAADLLLHPAYNENTGTVLLEALVSGLPVLTTDVCGYAEYVQLASAGRVISSPYQQIEFNQALKNMLLSPERTRWQQNGLAFAKSADIYSLPERAVGVLESLR